MVLILISLAIGAAVADRHRGQTPPPADPTSSAASSVGSPSETTAVLAGRDLYSPENPSVRGADDPWGSPSAGENSAEEERKQFLEALRTLREKAETGDVRAQLELGALCEAGQGVIQDFAEAARWFQKAAEQGDREAMMRLGHMAAAGRGMPRDLVQAYVWLNLAAARGESEAERTRDRIRGLLNAAEIREAQERSRVLDRKLPSG